MSLARYSYMFLALSACIYTHAQRTVALTGLKGFSSCMAPEYSYLSPALGPLFETYAQNLALLGDETSEAVILAKELFNSDNNRHKRSTSIGTYLEPISIGSIIGLVVQHKANNLDTKAFIKKVNGILNKVVTRRQYEIKKAITEDLQKSIALDNRYYKELEQKIIALTDKKERSDLELALRALSNAHDNTTETAVSQKITKTAQHHLWTQLKELSISLRKKRALLDDELRTMPVASHIFKDSMAAFVQALSGSLAEENTLYLPDNTVHLLLALLWQRAQTYTDLRDALQAMAESLTVEQDSVYQWHSQEPFTQHEYESLITNSGQSIVLLPTEDIIFARFGHTLYPHKGPAADAALYTQNFIQAQKTAKNIHEKSLYEALIAAWAPQWSDLKDMDPKIVYCRFLMQPAGTAAERNQLVKDICYNNITMGRMANYYIIALSNIYLALPQNISAQQTFFDTVITSIIENRVHPTLLPHIKKICMEWIQNSHNDITKTALASLFIKKHIFGTDTIKGFNPYGTGNTLLSMLKDIHNDTCKGELINLIAHLTTQNSSDIKEINELHEWAIATLSSIENESVQTSVILHLERDPINHPDLIQPLIQQYYRWASSTIDSLQDETNKAKLVLAALKISQENFKDDHIKILCKKLLIKTLPSIQSDEKLVNIISYIAMTFPQENPEIKEVYDQAYEWFAQKLPLIQDATVKYNIIKILLDKLATTTPNNKNMETMYNTLEKALQSIHDATVKVRIMEFLLERQPHELAQHKKLYITLYQWVEKNIPYIKEESIRENMLQKLSAIQLSIVDKQKD